MLVQYSVANFKSINEEVVINFSADKKARDREWIIKKEDLPDMYKCIALIGPNASGKTCILNSFLFAMKFIYGTLKRREDSRISVERFGLEEEYQEKPAAFEFIFYQEGIKYVYGFSVNETEVVEEYLMGYFSAKPKTLFDRSAGQHYEFKGNDTKTQTEISKKTNKNRLYMPVAAEWGYEPAKIVYQWFNFATRQYINFDINKIMGEIISDKKKKKVLLQELKNADFDIKDIYVKSKKLDKKSHDIMERFIHELVGELEEIIIPESTPIIHVVHENSSGRKIDLSLDEDSAGTDLYIRNIAELLYISDKGGFILEDELGKAYHAKLTQHYLEKIKSNAVNTGNVQILFTSHDTKILNLLNPDQVYLVDKDETGATMIKLLDDYIIRENDNIELGYLKGRYGSVPYMKG